MNKQTLEPYLEVRDFSVSGESFSLLYDRDLEMLITDPKPSIEELPRYYQSQDYISHTDSKRSLFEKVYHLVKRYAISKKLQLISRYARKGNLLDIGAGTADFLLAAQKQGWTTIGVEPGEQARQAAANKGATLNISTAGIPDGSQDVITMWHVLEHVPDVRTQIAELKRLLKKDGTCIIAVPNFKSFDALHYGAYWAAFDVPRHLYHYSQQSIRMLFAEQGMDVIHTHPMPFDAFYVSLLSEKYKTGKMRPGGLITGLRSNVKAMSTGEYSSLIYVITNK